MARYRFNKRAAKAYTKLEGEPLRRIGKALHQFALDHTHPSLRFKKASGTQDVYEITPSQGGGALRMLMKKTSDEEGEVYEIFLFGPHDVVRRI